MFSHKLDYSFIAVFVNYLSFNSLSKLKFWIVPPPGKKKKKCLDTDSIPHNTIPWPFPKSSDEICEWEKYFYKKNEMAVL